jgi:hypothetical protein
MLRFLCFLLTVSLILTGCQGTLEIGIGGRTPTAAGTPVTRVAIAEPVEGPTVTTEPTATATRSPTQTCTPSPTSTPTPTSLVPTVGPTRTPAPAGPEILAFGVSPAVAEPGDTVVLTWQARGTKATICPTARFILFTGDDCWPVPLVGATTFTIPPEAAGFYTIGFILEVEGAAPAAAISGQVSVALKCDGSWFFTDEPQAGICPLEARHSYAAAQRFERGIMIWLEEPGRYYILEDTPVLEGAPRKKVDLIDDPLEIVRDTSSDVEAPPGLHAPLSGFGLVWRGDVKGSPGYRDRLGWALESEFGYEAVLQCDDALPSGGRSWRTCYLRGPDGEVFVLHPLGGWQLLGADKPLLVVRESPIVATGEAGLGRVESVYRRGQGG